VQHRDLQHHELLELARTTRRAADARDRTAIVRSSNRLLTALAMHLDDEMNGRLFPDPIVRAAAARDQQTLIERLVTLTHAAAAGDSGPSLERLAEEVQGLLQLQIEVEAAA
jgi:hypothetical protein